MTERQNVEAVSEKQSNAALPKRGRLKIFFGYAPGVGKSYAMLKAAHAAKKKGVDVAVGCMEQRARTETAVLLQGLPTIKPQKYNYKGSTLTEFNLDEALARRPDLILMDELAHTNVPLCRHSKRYQDVEELLRSGIDVYTTANVQDIESLSDRVAEVTGITDCERIPDHVFDDADQVEWIDIEPEELVERLQSAKPHPSDRAPLISKAYFSVENLTALKEIALRRCADRIAYLKSLSKGRTAEFYTDEHILVCLSSAPTNAKNIRTASRMALAFRGAFTALFVKTPDYAAMSEENKARLQSNMRLAEQLGAKIETVHGDDVPYQIAEFARRSGVSKIVLGRSVIGKHKLFGKPTLTERLAELVPNLDIYIIPDTTARTAYKHAKAMFVPISFSFWDILKTLVTLALISLIGFAFEHLGFDEGNIITLYILGVLIISVITKHQIYGLVASGVSVLIFNFFFTEPKFTFRADDKGYLITFAVMFIVSLLTGSLATKLKKNAKQSARAAFRTKVLLDTTQLLGKAESTDAVFDVTAKQLTQLLGKSVILYVGEKERLGEPREYPHTDGVDLAQYRNADERSVAEWTYRNNKQAGRGTDTFGNAQCLYFSVRTAKAVYGVAGIAMNGEGIESYERSILLSILDECALSLESKWNAKEKEEAAVLAKNEQLRANLLRSISHDLRTPLTSISGNACNLLSNGDYMESEVKRELYANIYDDSMWLITLVENLLAVTKLEGDAVHLKMTTELVGDVIDEALKHVSRNKDKHSVTVDLSDEYLLAKMDVRLVVQVIVNLVDNAIKYTDAGSEICIKAYPQGDRVHIRVSDNGNGIPDEMKERVFDMFYTGAMAVADSRRSLGLGLFLCRSIVHAHGGSILLTDNVPHGAVFDFTLEKAEVDLNEQI